MEPEDILRNRELKFNSPNCFSVREMRANMQALKYHSPALEKKTYYNCDEKFHFSK